MVPGKDHCWELVNIRVAVQLGRFIDQPIDCSERLFFMDFDVLLAVHLSIILVINQLNAQNLLYSKCIICLRVSSTMYHHQEFEIVLYSIWCHHTFRWPTGAQVERRLLSPSLNLCTGRSPTRAMIPDAL